MTNYQHKKGKIKSNALAALMSDPLFKQRIEKNVKGKGSFRRKNKHSKMAYQGADESGLSNLFSSAF